jgi:hypothetical protein
MSKTQTEPVICINNRGYAASLERLKVYFASRDAGDEKHGLLRVVDESGNSYLYPKRLFLALPQSKAMASKAKAILAGHKAPRRTKTAA